MLSIHKVFLLIGEKKVYKLKRSFYDLKQVCRTYYNIFYSYLLIVYVYVENIIYTSPSLSSILKFKNSMMFEFDTKNLRLIYYFLGFKSI